jgi:hypothetical protein
MIHVAVDCKVISQLNQMDLKLQAFMKSPQHDGLPRAHDMLTVYFCMPWLCDVPLSLLFTEKP